MCSDLKQEKISAHASFIQWNLHVTDLYITKSSVERTIFFTPVILRYMKKNLGPSLNRGSTVINLSNITENYYATFKASFTLNCKTKILAYSSAREHSNKRSGARLKTKREMGRDALQTCKARALRACETFMLRSIVFFFF